MMISLVRCKWNATSLRIAACAATKEREDKEVEAVQTLTEAA
jgi:hypothetical protein